MALRCVTIFEKMFMYFAFELNSVNYLAPFVNFMSMKKLTTVLLALMSLGCLSQTIEKDIHTREQLWLGYFNQTRLTNKFGLWLDVHYRQTDNFLNRPFQFMVRPALNFYIKDNVRLQTGYVFVNHFPPEGVSISRPEHRTWQQIWWNQKYSRFATVQWLRLEERFNKKIVNNELQPETIFTLRARYQYSFFIPLKGNELKPKTPFLALANEVFVNFGKKAVYNTFDQNRLFVGLGYQFTSHLHAQLGYMNVYQQEASGNNYFATHAIRCFVFQTLDFRKQDL
jgi:hypothetical protein